MDLNKEATKMKQKWSYRLASRFEWNRVHGNGLRPRLWDLACCREPWWQWGRRLMILTGSDFGGNWQEPKPGTWWYKRGPSKRQWRTGFPKVSSFEVIRDYGVFSDRTKGLNEDGMYEWQAIYVSSDGELSLGHRWWGGSFYGMRADEVRLLRSYLRMWRRHDWWGLRSWLYFQGLHQAVHGHRPFACAVVPERGSGGCDHWHCDGKRGHDGQHSYRSMTWAEGGKVERRETAEEVA